MFDFFSALPPTLQALIAGLFTWGVTALGAAIVFFFASVNKTVMDAMLGFAAGVMVAASFWSLLSPAIVLAEQLFSVAWLPVLAGFLCGGLLLFLGDRLFPVICAKTRYAETVTARSKRTSMLVFSIVLHNIPEGLAVGIAFGSIPFMLSGATLASACLLSFGIGLQNFPEGTAVSIPLRRDGFSRKRAFFYGQMSGIVEPISAVLGAALVMIVRPLLPFLLAFAAGAMIYVVVEELIPESQTNEKKDFMAFFSLIGFSVMMVLDVSLG